MRINTKACWLVGRDPVADLVSNDDDRCQCGEEGNLSGTNDKNSSVRLCSIHLPLNLEGPATSPTGY